MQVRETTCVRRVRWVALVVALAAIVPLPGVARGAAGPFARCEAPSAPRSIGVVACRREPSARLGGTTAFEYYVPPRCATRRCPTLYLLHGFGGDLTSMLGTPGRPSAWVAALTRRPPVSPYATAQPWKYADQRRWKAASPIDMVLVAPDGRTVPGGFGPGGLLDGFWADWNPRYAKGGADEAYATPPPRFESYVVDELVPFVERHLQVAKGRASRALDGESLGGYGSYAIGLLHPDEWASIGAVSGIMNILLAPGLAGPSPISAPGGLPEGQLPLLPLPALLGAPVPVTSLPGPAQNFGVVLYAFGDPVADQAYFLARQPVDLALNASADRGDRQSLAIRGFSNDTVPRVASDFSLPDYLISQAFEDLVLPTNVEMNQAFAQAGVRQHYELHAGIHKDEYWNPWLRAQAAAQYAAVRHWDGGGNPPPRPNRFSYASGEKSFSVWGWHFKVHRPVDEMLRITNATCHGYTLTGSGQVTVQPPPRCNPPRKKLRAVTTDLGPSLPVNQTAGADAIPGYERTARITLKRASYGYT
ncbi:MAG TPA: alpha/beta hydrolase-fold protein [Mycobacteriales bacterium]|nr:alpha/beta hydrolase-fold protein [Mycobacteriales bacterium]